MIVIRNLVKRLSPDFSLVVDDLTIKDGEKVALVGVNGSGKSTLLRLVAGVLKPDEGEITVTGKVGYSPQSPYAFRGTALFNVTVADKTKKDPGPVLEACELTALRDKKMTALSGGERQRVFLARSLLGDYSVLLLDEPLSAADIETGRRLSAVIKQYAEQKRATLLFSTHLPRQAFDIADKVLLLDAGRVAEYGDVKRLSAPESAFGKLFLSQFTS